MEPLVLGCLGWFDEFIHFQQSGLGATLNVAKPKKGSSVAIFGLGAVGLAVSLWPTS